MRLKVNGVELYVEVEGDGHPLLLLEGLGYHHWMWFKQRPALSRRFRLISVDNRGVGHSDKPDEPYSIRKFADDAAAVLDALGIERAHVLGISMGGFIAQEFALAYPRRTGRLVLGCTSFGGPRSIPVPPATLAVMTDRTGSPEDIVRRGLAIAASPGYWDLHPEELERIVRWRLELPVPNHAYMRQLAAAAAHDAADRVGQITAPTLIATGDRDRVVPAENSDLLAAAIPGSRVVRYPGAGHLFFIEQADRFNADVEAFLT